MRNMDRLILYRNGMKSSTPLSHPPVNDEKFNMVLFIKLLQIFLQMRCIDARMRLLELK